ncbi:Proton-coupled folate transporter [Trichostrongylus colubriformis]|uniref:Proton-coupled folate transporter n=1 Tax=Trichostrongylus colubriformis TaxID=6319 RepID=A0AAN8F1G3_TRICO
MMMVAVSLGLYGTSSPLFTYWARCIAIATSDGKYDVDNATSICGQLSGSEKDLQNAVEKDIASTKIFLQIANSIPTLLTAPLIGTWSDKRGRKNPLLYTVFGVSLYTTCQLMATLTYRYMNIYYWYFAGEILIGTLGMTLLAVPGQSPGYLHQLSYVTSTSLQVSFALIALAYTFIMVRETHFPLNDVYSYDRLDGTSSSSSNDQPKTLIMKIRDYMVALIDVITRKRPGWTRCCLIMSLFFVMIEFLALDMSLLFLLVKRPPFSWSDKTFSNFALIKGVLFSAGMVLCPLLLTLVHWLGKDSLMIIVGIAASAVSFLLISNASTTMEIFLTSGLALLCGGIAPGYRSFLPRMVPKEQTARLLTVCSIIMAFCPMLSSLIFNPIFNATLGWWPGFAFFVGGILQLLVVVGQSGIHCLMRPQWLMEKRLKAQLNTHSVTVGDSGPDDIGQSPASSGVAACSDLNITGEPVEDEPRNIHI